MTQAFVETLRQEDIPDEIKEAALREGVALDQFVKEGLLMVASRIVQQAEEEGAQMSGPGVGSIHGRGRDGAEEAAGNKIDEITDGGESA